MRNQIHIPSSSFLKESIREYSAVNPRLLCELSQNAIDAGADEVHFSFYKGKLVCQDNGSGMTEKVLKTGLLTYAGSVKGPDAVGFAGAAKKIILFSHDSYRIQTRQFVACGRGIDYKLYRQTEFDKCILGTKISIKFSKNWPDYDCLESVLKDELKTIVGMSTLKAKIYWNGELIEQAPDSPIELDEETAIIRKGVKPGIVVRFNGLYMFSQYSNHSYFYDCKGHSRDALNQNRESFRFGIYKEKYSSFLNTLANNNQSGISAQADYQKKKDTQRVIEGITFVSDNLPYKLSKRQKSIYALCQTVCEMMGWVLPKSHFGFYVNPNVRGLGSPSAIFINPEYFMGDDWELDCINTFMHEWCHYKGYSHDESFINYFGSLWVKFMDKYSGINPLKARTRIIEKREFPNY